MIVITMSKCPPSLKGDLSKWMFEMSPGVYIGNLSRRVRDRLWERIQKSIHQGWAVMAYNAQCEQSFQLEIVGDPHLSVEDYDGIQLIKHLTTSQVSGQDTRQGIHTSSCVSQRQIDVKADPPAKTKTESPAKSRQFSLPDSFVILDIETTGLDPESDEIIEIGAVKILRQTIVDTFQAYVQIPSKLPDFISELTGITDDLLLSQGKEVNLVLEYLQAFIGDLPIAGHNIEFDLSFLRENYPVYPFRENAIIDSLALARNLKLKVKNYKLKTLLEYFSIQQQPVHSALPDCEAVYFLLSKLNKIEDL